MHFHYLFALLVSPCLAEVFTAMADVSRLLSTESEMIRTLENYITAHETRLRRLKSDLAEMERVHDIAAKDTDNFISNPLNVYLLVKRLTLDWSDLQNILTEDTVGQALLTNLSSIAAVPDEEDLNGVAIGLLRLQDTYRLETSQLSSGRILDLSPAYRSMTAADCFELGRQSYNSGDYYHTLLWMNEAMRILEQEDVPSVPQTDILEYLAFSTYMQGNLERALKLTNELLEKIPNHPRAKGNHKFYEEELRRQNKPRKGEVDGIPDEALSGYTISESSTAEMDEYQRERDAYERLCREEYSVDHSDSSLKCFYKFKPSAFLHISPVKTEVLHINPTVYIFHDVLSDNEAKIIKELATPRFQRATVQNYKTGELETATYRISKSAWLKEEESPYVSMINRRIEDMTDLFLGTAEELQVANYGIGGHYEPHFDYARREERDAFKSLGTGNRIATFLFYMTDVTAGGSTIFPHLNLAVKPKKGAAAFWHNLHLSGEGDVLTRHAACPVLMGHKWVANKWIHERGQEFLRPCSVNFDDLANVM